jgi:hypothetical protein
MMHKIYLDENLSPYVAQAMQLLCRGYFNEVEVYSTVTVFGRGTPDEEIIPKIGAEGSILITRDFNIQRDRLQKQLLADHGLGVFFIRLPKRDDRHWELVRLMVDQWEELIKKVNKTKPPFSFIIHPRGKMQSLS